MDANISAILYLVSGVFFIMALRGLSSPETSRQGNYFGIVGMTIAVATTLLDPSIDMSDPSIVQLVVAGIVIGGVIDSIIARRISMTAMPQLVAAYHSLVGLAAVLVAWAAYLAPERAVEAELGVPAGEAQLVLELFKKLVLAVGEHGLQGIGVRGGIVHGAHVRGAGGGGFGDPVARDPEKVARDVKNGIVSRQSAEEHYRVKLQPDGNLDAVETQALRGDLPR